MKISSYKEFSENHKTWNEKARQEAFKQFSYTVVIEGYYPENDVACRWAWNQFGEMDCEECGDYCSEYPACPKVLAIEEYVVKKSYTDSQGVAHEYNFHTRDPGKHGHKGNWTIVWLGKTDYDYGFTEYYFKNKEDCDRFTAAIPTFGLGEHYED